MVVTLLPFNAIRLSF